ncbi:hypothetical protein SVIOM342S_02179 [Streptomyces violaceorubidus]
MFLVLLLLVVVAVVSAVGLTGHGASVLAARRARGPGAGPGLHALAAFAGAAALAAYAWGLLHVTGAVMESGGGANSSPAPPCRMPGYEERALHVIDQSVPSCPWASSARPPAAGNTPATTSPATSTPPPPSWR